ANALYRREEANALDTLSTALQVLKRTDEAIDRVTRAIAIQQQLAAGDPRSASFRLDLVRSQKSLAFLLLNAGKRQEAIDSYRQPLAGPERLVAEQPLNPEFRYERAAANNGIAGISLPGDSKTAEARKAALEFRRKAESELEEIVRQYPDRSEYSTLL